MLTEFYGRARIFFAIAVFAVIGVAALLAQAVNRTISGTITDPSGAAIANAMVQVRNNATQVARTVTTNAAGRHSAPVRVSRPGFQNSVQINFGMKIGPARELLSVLTRSDRASKRDVFGVA